MSCRGLACRPAAHFILVRFYGLAVAFRLAGASIVSAVESHLFLLKELWLAVDKVIHHDYVVAAIVIRSRGNVAGRDPD